MKARFLFSVITAVKNGTAFLPRLLRSLADQTYGEWECLVQDGGSTDGTLALLAEAQDPRIQTQSEPDTGVYQAWNRALARANGEWFMFLGADDALAGPHILAQAARTLMELPSDILFAQAGLHVGKNGEPRDTVARSRAEVFRFFISGMPLLTPAVFFRKSLFAGGAGFDERYKIAGDFAFVAERLAPGNLALLPFVAAYMEAGGLSSAVKSRPLLDAERKRVLAEVVKPRAAELVQACIDTYGDNARPLL